MVGLVGTVLHGEYHGTCGQRRQAGNLEKSVAKILKACVRKAVKGGEVEEDGKAGSWGGEEAVGRDFEVGGDVEDGVAEEVEEQGSDVGGIGDGEKGLVDEGIVDAEEAEDESLMVGGRGDVVGDGDGWKVVEGNGRESGFDALDVSSSGAGVEGDGSDQDGDRERCVEVEKALPKFHHRNQMAHARRWVEHDGVFHFLLFGSEN